MSDQTIQNDVAAIVACIAYNMEYGLESPKFQFKDDDGQWYRFSGNISKENVSIDLSQPSSSQMKIIGSSEKYQYYGSSDGNLEIENKGSYYSGRDTATGMNFTANIESSRVTFTNDSNYQRIVFESFS